MSAVHASNILQLTPQRGHSGCAAFARETSQLVSSHTCSDLLQGRCGSSDPAVDLELAQAEADELIPFNPDQCLILVDTSWLMLNNGSLWLDNVYVKVDRRRALPGFAFITAGINTEDTLVWGHTAQPGLLQPADVYITSVTFHSEWQRNAIAITTEIPSSSVLISGAPRCSKQAATTLNATQQHATMSAFSSHSTLR